MYNIGHSNLKLALRLILISHGDPVRLVRMSQEVLMKRSSKVSFLPTLTIFTSVWSTFLLQTKQQQWNAMKQARIEEMAIFVQIRNIIQEVEGTCSPDFSFMFFFPLQAIFFSFIKPPIMHKAVSSWSWYSWSVSVLIELKILEGLEQWQGWRQVVVVMVALIEVLYTHFRRAMGPVLMEILLFSNITFCFKQVAWIGVIDFCMPKKFSLNIPSSIFSTTILPLSAQPTSLLLNTALLLFSINIFHLSRDSNMFPIISSLPFISSLRCTWINVSDLL